MRRSGIYPILFLVLATFSIAFGQGTVGTQVSADVSASSKSSSGAPPEHTDLPAIDLPAIEGRLNTIDGSLTKLVSATEKKESKTAYLGFYGVLAGGLVAGTVAFITQNKLLKHQKKLADEQAKLQIGNSFVPSQLQQLSELYGPLHALFQQSNALYLQMNGVLAKARPDIFKFQTDSTVDPPINDALHILIEGTLVRFRTILHINEVYGKGYGIEEYIYQIVSIGSQIVKVISEKAGYARPDQPELMAIFGKYLAHFSVLKSLYTQVETDSRPAIQNDTNKHPDVLPPLARPMEVMKSAVFPNQIQSLVEEGFKRTTNELNAWRARALS